MLEVGCRDRMGRYWVFGNGWRGGKRLSGSVGNKCVMVGRVLRTRGVRG